MTLWMDPCSCFLPFSLHHIPSVSVSLLQGINLQIISLDNVCCRLFRSMRGPSSLDWVGYSLGGPRAQVGNRISHNTLQGNTLRSSLHHALHRKADSYWHENTSIWCGSSRGKIEDPMMYAMKGQLKISTEACIGTKYSGGRKRIFSPGAN